MDGKLKQQPAISANGLTNDELFAWMKEKALAAAQLKAALAERQALKQALNDIDKQIEELTSSAALELLDKAQDPILLQENH